MIYLDNNTFQQEIFIPRSSVKNDASPEYATKNELENAIENEVIRADEKYAAKTDLLPYATTGWVESQGYLKEHQDISGKLDTSDFAAYTANTQTELNNKQDASAMTAYYTSAQTDTAIQNATNGLASEEWVESQGYLTGYTETDPVFMASAASGITSQDITNWNNKLDSSDLEPYYTSAQTDNAISDAVSGKADLSAVTAQISEVKAQIEAEIPSKVSDLQNDLNFVNSGDVKTQVESYNYINSGQAQTQIDNSISGKLDTDIFTNYTANTQTELNNKQDISGMTEYATTAFTESTYLKEHQSLSAYSTTEQMNQAIGSATAATTGWVESQGYITEHQSLSAYTPTSGFSTINGSAITEGGNIVIQGGSGSDYSAGANIDITNNVISVTGLATINGSAITEGGNIVIQGGGGSGGGETVIELTQAQYDALTEYAQDTTYIITDAPSIDLDNYYTSAQTEDAITTQTSLKQDTLVSGTNIKTINGQSILGNGDMYISQGLYYQAGAGLNLINGNTFEVKDYKNLKQGARLGEIEKVISIALNDLNNRLKNLE